MPIGPKHLASKKQSTWTKKDWQDYAVWMEAKLKKVGKEAKAGSADDPPEVEPDEADDDVLEMKKTAKLVPPKKQYSGQDADDFENWKRAVQIWRNKFPWVSDKRMGAELMEVITDKAETTVYASIPDGEETYSRIMKILELRHGKRAMPKTMEYSLKFQKCVRGKETMREFLNTYSMLKAKAEQCGEQMCPLTAGTKLLNAAELGPSSHSSVLATLSKSSGPNNMPTYEDVLEQLELLAQTYEAFDDARRIKDGDKKKGVQAFFAEGEAKGGQDPAWTAKGKGKGSRGISSAWGKGSSNHGRGKQGKGKSKDPKGKGKGKPSSGKGKGVCWNWEKTGTCPFGEECRFEHAEAKGGTKRSGGDGGSEVRPAKRLRIN